MLAITRRIGEPLVIGGAVHISIESVGRDAHDRRCVCFGIAAPPDIEVLRAELYVPGRKLGSLLHRPHRPFPAGFKQLYLRGSDRSLLIGDEVRLCVLRISIEIESVRLGIFAPPAISISKPSTISKRENSCVNF